MVEITIAVNPDDLLQIYRLSSANLKQNLSSGEQREEGFVTWLYSIELLRQMHALAPSIIARDGNSIAAYALTALRECSSFHPDLKEMFQNLLEVNYQGKPLSSHNFYCMGQICVAKEYRGKGLVKALYQKHKEIYSHQYDFLLTEISTCNHRSLKAHQKVGFKTVHTHRDALDEWDVLVWDWT